MEKTFTRIHMPDCNKVPLNGDDPAWIKETFSVDVLVVGTYGPGPCTHSIVISGEDDEGINRYIDRLTSTWPCQSDKNL